MLARVVFWNVNQFSECSWHFDLNNIDSYELIAKHLQTTNFLQWTSLGHSVPFNLRNAYHNPDYTTLNQYFKIHCGFFDVILL